MKVLVTGGRNFNDRNELWGQLDAIHGNTPITKIIHGAAMGADTLAEGWAKYREIPYVGYPAQWKKHGNKAGPLRNIDMLTEERPDLVVAFKGGPGTKHCISMARSLFAEVIVQGEDF